MACEIPSIVLDVLEPVVVVQDVDDLLYVIPWAELVLDDDASSWPKDDVEEENRALVVVDVET